MVSRSRSSSRMTRSKPVARKSKSPASKSSSPARKMRSKSPRKMTRRLSARKGSRKMSPRGSRKMSRASRPKTDLQKWKSDHKDEITAKVKSMGHTGNDFIKYYAKVAKQMAADAGLVAMGKKAPKMPKTSTVRRARVSAMRKMKAGGLSQSAEQKLRALFSRSPSRYTLRAGKKGTRVVLKRRSRKTPKLTKSGKVRKTPKPNAYNLWFKQHAAQVSAEVARRGMAGQGIKAYGLVGHEMYKASRA